MSSNEQRTQPTECVVCLHPISTSSSCSSNNEYKCSTCSQSICLDCLYEWLSSQLKNNLSTQNHRFLRCFNESCSCLLEIAGLIHLFKTESAEYLNSQLLNIYLSNQRDCVQCLKCGCFGFSEILADQPEDQDQPALPCGPLICPQCEQPYRTSTTTTTYLTTLYELFFTDPCPQCGVYIQKTGGCSTMECKKCDYKFCWYCKKPGESNHNRKLCIGHQAAKWLIYCNILTNVVLILDAHLLIAAGIEMILAAIGNIFFGSLILKFFFYNLFLVSAGMTLIGLKSILEIIIKIISENRQGIFVESHYKKRRKFIKKTVFHLAMTLIEVLIIDFNDSFSDMISFIVTEIILVVSFVAIYAVCSVLPQYVHRRCKNRNKISKTTTTEGVFTYSYSNWLSKISKQTQ